MSAATKPSAWRNMVNSEQQDARGSLQRLVDDLVASRLHFQHEAVLFCLPRCLVRS